MTLERFRYQALLQVFQTKEDLLEQEMASLQRERRELGKRIQHLLLECERTRKLLVTKGQVEDFETFLRYMEGTMVRVQESGKEDEALQKRILGRLEELRKVRTERMRFGKLKDQHEEKVQRFVKKLEQKVSDEFAQRKQTT